MSRPIWAGTIGPVASTIDRRPRSIRRTTSVDICWRNNNTETVLTGVGRDMVTGDTSDDVRILEVAATTVVLDATAYSVHSATIANDPFGIAAWLPGRPAHFKIRKLLHAEHPDFVDSGSLAALLIDEVPGAALISYLAVMRDADPPEESLDSLDSVDHNVLPELANEASARNNGPATNVCAGWIDGGSMYAGMSTRPFLGEGPPAPSLLRDDDPIAWHVSAELGRGDICRRRLIDVARNNVSGDYDVAVFFRDSFIERDMTTSVVHEYGLDLVVDAHTHEVVSIDVSPHVLPSPECPSAVASAQRIVGMHVADVRTHVSARFRGTSTCTHLNDALRSLGDLDVLIAALDHSGVTHA